MASDRTSDRVRPVRRSTLTLAVLLSTLASALAVIVGWALYHRDPLPRLTAETLAAAEQRWQAAAPADYDLDLKLGGSQSGTIHLEVRGGQATDMIRNGQRPKQQRTWFYWTVPGMFETLGRELENSSQPERAFGAPPGATVDLYARFDPQLGYPVKYRRAVLGSDKEIAWEVTAFTKR